MMKKFPEEVTGGPTVQAGRNVSKKKTPWERLATEPETMALSLQWDW